MDNETLFEKELADLERSLYSTGSDPATALTDLKIKFEKTSKLFAEIILQQDVEITKLSRVILVICLIGALFIIYWGIGMIGFENILKLKPGMFAVLKYIFIPIFVAVVGIYIDRRFPLFGKKR